jgi:hypothetical protein
MVEGLGFSFPAVYLGVDDGLGFCRGALAHGAFRRFRDLVLGARGVPGNKGDLVLGARGLPGNKGADGQESEWRCPWSKVPGGIEGGNPGSYWYHGYRNIETGIDE